MQSFRLEDWQRWQQQGCTWLPATVVHRRVAVPVSWERFAAAPASVLLESAQAGRYSYLCDRPERVIVGQAEDAEVWSGDMTARRESRLGAPLDVVTTLLAERKAPVLTGWPAMTGGLLGAFGYDLVHTWERLPLQARRDVPLPLYVLIETRELFIYDHAEQTLGVVVWREIQDGGEQLAEVFREAQAAAEEAVRRWEAEMRMLPAGAAERRAGETPPGRRGSSKDQDPSSRETPGTYLQGDAKPSNRYNGDFAASFEAEGFCAAVRRVQEYIAAGHTYQVNLSLRTSRATALPAAQIYEALRRVNPSPYMGLLRLPDFALVCGSPELLVRAVDGVVSSRPIAGTRPRGAAVGEDTHLSAELFASEKERAEHLMLVDLIRNDIGRVAAFGSVHVPEFMVLERYSHVMHIVSQVEGRLGAGRTWADVLRAMFPGGTITGCPKIRTMEIIEELEPVGRGFYTGALGWISHGGAMEMNIVIRSMLVQRGVAHVQAGSGIVADSHPERELDEARRKAQALWVALDVATQLHG